MAKGSIPRSKSGKILDYLINRSNVGKPFRAAVDLMRDPPSLTGPIRSKDIERSFSAASLATSGSMVAKRPSGSVGTGGRQYKVSGATPKVQVNQPKPGSSKFIGPVKPKAKNKSKAQAISSSSSSPRYKVTGAQPNYTGPKPKPGSKNFIGPIRPTQQGPIRPTPKRKNKNLPKYAAIVAAETAVLGGGAYATYKLTMPENKKNIIGNNPNRGLAYYGYSSGSSEKPTGGGPERRQGSQAPSMNTASTSMDKRISESAKLERLRATRAASAKTKTYKEKNFEANKKVGAAASAAAKAEAKPVVAKKKKEQPRPAFKGNWTGAAPTEMQKRGGARIKRPNLLSLLKKK